MSRGVLETGRRKRVRSLNRIVQRRRPRDRSAKIDPGPRLRHQPQQRIARGTEAQKAFHLPRILSGEALWCQGFSEPNAGSDLAALKTRGVIEGEHIVVTGAKMWTTDAQYADYQELLIRTDPVGERHKGLTWVICDMKSPGIDIKPIRTMLQDVEMVDRDLVFRDQTAAPTVKISRLTVAGQ